MNRVRGQARGISRVVALTTAVWCLGLLARAVETSCVVAGSGIAPDSSSGLDAGAASITGIRDMARFTADLMVIPSSLAVAGLAAVALGSLIVLVRSNSDRAGATFAALALYGALAPSDDPHEIDIRTDREAAHVARTGPSTQDASSRRLRDALIGEGKRQTTVGLHGHGSPIPRVLPDQEMHASTERQ